MPKSKGRRHPEKKKKPGIATAVKTETSEVAKAHPMASSSTIIETRRMEAQPPYPYLGKELLRIGIVATVTIIVLIILTLALR